MGKLFTNRYKSIRPVFSIFKCFIKLTIDKSNRIKINVQQAIGIYVNSGVFQDVLHNRPVDALLGFALYLLAFQSLTKLTLFEVIQISVGGVLGKLFNCFTEFGCNNL